MSSYQTLLMNPSRNGNLELVDKVITEYIDLLPWNMHGLSREEVLNRSKFKWELLENNIKPVVLGWNLPNNKKIHSTTKFGKHDHNSKLLFWYCLIINPWAEIQEEL